MAETEHAASRHRSAGRFDLPVLPGRAVRVLSGLAPVLSLLPALVAVVAVQATSPVAQRLPEGAARFDAAAALLVAQPGALAGWASWAGGRTPGLWQLGVLSAAVGGGRAPLAAEQVALLVVAGLQTALLWLLVRRLGGSALAAGLAAAAAGIAPAALLARTAAAPEAVGVAWALAAAVLAVGTGRIAALAAGVAAAFAVAAAPVLAAPLAVPVVAGLIRRRDGRRARIALPAPVPAAAGFAVGAAVWLVALLATAPQAAGRSARELQAVLAAAPGPSLGIGGPAAAVAADPVGAVLAVVAVVALAVRSRDRTIAALVVVASLAGVWPLGQDPTAALTVLVPAAGLAIAVVTDRAVVLLGDPVFRRSLIGSGWLTGVAAVLVVAVVAWLTGLSALVPAASTAAQRTARWVREGVPAGQRVLADLGAWPDLAAAGDRVGWYAVQADGGVATSMPWADARWIVQGAGLARATSSSAARALAGTEPVARFGSGSQTLVVRAARPSSTPSPTVTAPSTPQERAAAAARLAAGAQLAANPRLTLDAAGRAMLVEGRVDTRIALVLAQFATQHRVTVASFSRVPGDTTGIATVVVVGAVDGSAVPADARRTGELLRFLSALQGVYRARTIDASGEGVSATFAPDPTFVPSA